MEKKRNRNKPAPAPSIHQWTRLLCVHWVLEWSNKSSHFGCGLFFWWIVSSGVPVSTVSSFISLRLQLIPYWSFVILSLSSSIPTSSSLDLDGTGQKLVLRIPIGPILNYFYKTDSFFFFRRFFFLLTNYFSLSLSLFRFQCCPIKSDAMSRLFHPIERIGIGQVKRLQNSSENLSDGKVEVAALSAGRGFFFFFIPFYLIFLCLFLFPVPDLLHFDKKTVVGRIKKGSPRSFTAAAWLNFLDFFFCFFFSHFQSESNDPSTLTGHGSDNGAQQKNSTTPLQPSSPSIQQHPAASSSIQQHPAAASGSRKWTLCTRIQSA